MLDFSWCGGGQGASIINCIFNIPQNEAKIKLTLDISNTVLDISNVVLEISNKCGQILGDGGGNL